MHGLLASDQGNRRLITSGYRPNPGGDGRHRWAGKERSGGSGNVCSRGIPDHRHLQVEETNEEETSIPQVGWSWTISQLEPMLIHQYQLLANLIEVMHESHVQSQKKAKDKNPCKQWISWLIF